MKTIELVTKKRLLGACDQCGDTQGVREYLLPYDKDGRTGRYRDLCQTCQRRIQAMPGDCIAQSLDLPRFGSARRERGVS
jgi:hypothetical protein